MAKHTSFLLVCIGLCLHDCIIIKAYALSSPSKSVLDQTKMVQGSDFDSTRKKDFKKLPIVEEYPEKVKSDGNVSTGSIYNEDSVNIFDDRSEAEETRYITNNRDNVGRKRSEQDEKRRLRFHKRHQSGPKIHVKECGNDARSHSHSVRKRQTITRDEHPLSISNQLSILTDIVMEHNQNRLAEEQREMARKMYELGKRSEVTLV